MEDWNNINVEPANSAKPAKPAKPAFIVLGLIVFIIIVIAVVIIINTTRPEPISTESTSEQIENIEKAFLKQVKFLENKITIDRTEVLESNKYAAVISWVDFTTYRALLVNKDGEWTLAGTPAAVLMYEEYPDYNKSLIRKVNDLPSNKQEVTIPEGARKSGES